MSLDQSVNDAIAEFSGSIEDFKAKQEKATAETRELLAKQGDASSDALAKAEKAAEEVTAAATRLKELEQQVASYTNVQGNTPRNQSLGEMVVSDASYKALGLEPGQTPDAGFKLKVHANTLTGQSSGDSDDTLVPAHRRPGIVPGAFRALRIVDLLTTIPISSNSWEFTKENSWTNAAAETAEAAAKPEATLGFVLSSVSIRTIAHFIKATNQIIADAPALRAYIDRRLTHGVNNRLDAQLITGDGTGQNISGMATSGNHTAFTPTTGDTAIDSINRAKYTIIAADYAADGVLLNPSNWGAIERLKTSDNAYLVGNPFGSIVPVMWGLPVVVSNNMTADKMIVADFANAYEHLNRQGVAVDLGFVNDDFTKNLVTIRAERRDALATLVPAASLYGDLTQ